MSIQLALVAHAATAATRAASFPADEPVDPAGQAAAAACRFRRVDAALASPARAARETAAAFGLQATIAPELRDLDAGAWAGRTLDDVAAIDPAGLAAWLSDPDAAPHGGETLRHLLARTAAWLRSLPPGTHRLVVVAPPSLLRAALVAALDAPPAAFWRIDAGPLDRLVLHGHGARWTLRSLSRLRPLDSATVRNP